VSVSTDCFLFLKQSIIRIQHLLFLFPLISDFFFSAFEGHFEQKVSVKDMIFKGKDSVDHSFLSYGLASLKVSDKQKK